MKYLVITFALFFVLTLSLPSTHGLVMPMSTEQILDGFDLIVIGTVTSVEVPDDMPPVFQIEIEETVKPNSFSQKTVDALGCNPNSGVMGVPCPNYKTGDRGLFLIQNSSKGYDLSFRSQVAEVDCTAKQFLKSYSVSRSSFYWRQNGQSDTFFTGEPTDVHFVVRNQDLKEKNYSVQFTAGTNGATFSDIVNGTVGKCVGYAKVIWTFVPTKMGTYNFKVQSDSGGRGSYGTTIIDYGSSPREQFKAGVHGQDAWCRDGLFLILKNDDTKPRWDNQPACVTIKTMDTLVERNWGFVPPESNTSGYMGKR